MKLRSLSFVLMSSILLLTYRADAAPTKIEMLVDQPDEWFTGDEARKTLDVVLSYQNANGGWWKAYKLDAPRSASDEDTKDGIPGDNAVVWHRTSTIDNGATHSELRILARAFRVTKDPRFAASFRKGLKFLLDSQYPTGGWPQRFPLENNYGRHITYNDDAIIGVMRVLRDVVEAKPDYSWLSDEDRASAKASMEKGIECILATQILVDGEPTVWCQQHDEVTLKPASARSYELPSFSSTESAGIALFLMELPNPDSRVQHSIQGAAKWFEEHKITGKRVEKLTGPQYELGKQTNLVDDANAKPIWARFYDLETGKPYFCDRDGIKLDSFEKLGHERRVNYAWFNDRGNRLLDVYSKWLAMNR